MIIIYPTTTQLKTPAALTALHGQNADGDHSKAYFVINPHAPDPQKRLIYVINHNVSTTKHNSSHQSQTLNNIMVIFNFHYKNEFLKLRDIIYF